MALSIKNLSRSREGAWIEIPPAGDVDGHAAGRSREGAWIEMLSHFGAALAIWSLP